MKNNCNIFFNIKIKNRRRFYIDVLETPGPSYVANPGNVSSHF